VAKIVRRGHSGGVENRTPVQRLVDTMLDRAEAGDPSVEYVIWMPSLESLLLPRDPTDGPRTGFGAHPPLPHPPCATFRHPHTDRLGIPRHHSRGPAGRTLLRRRPSHRTHHPPLNHQ